jgi:hypothetical protein
MWMAEWFFTDLFEKTVVTASGARNKTNSGFRPIDTIHADCAEQVANRSEQKHRREQHSEKQFRGD